MQRLQVLESNVNFCLWKIYCLCQNNSISKKFCIKTQFSLLCRPLIFIVTIMSQILIYVYCEH